MNISKISKKNAIRGLLLLFLIIIFIKLKKQSENYRNFDTEAANYLVPITAETAGLATSGGRYRIDSLHSKPNKHKVTRQALNLASGTN